MHDTVIKMLDEVKQLWMATDSLKVFTDWLDDLIAINSAPNPAPAAEKIMAWRAHRENEADIAPGSCGSASSGISCQLAIYLRQRINWPSFS